LARASTYRCAERASGVTTEKRAGIFIGPEFGTVARQDLVIAAREASDANFDVIIACAFNFEALASEFNKLGRIPVLKARMNAELHMGTQLKNTGKGNPSSSSANPTSPSSPPADAPETADLKNFDTLRVRINGVDVFHPQTGEVRSDGADGIACWFIDTDYTSTTSATKS
jgi:adenine-specific DNA-methyltransferase